MSFVRTTITTALFLAGCTITSAVQACEEYVAIGADDLKAYRDKLGEVEADPFDQLFAFEALSCSDKPTIRAYAVKAGLEGSTDPIVRQQIMLEAMLQKARIDIELTAAPNSSKDDKQFIEEYAGILAFEVGFRSAVDGCITFVGYGSGCDSSGGFFIKGDEVDFSYSRGIGKFRLTDQNELVGFVRTDGSGNHGLIPAVISLF